MRRGQSSAAAWIIVFFIVALFSFIFIISIGYLNSNKLITGNRAGSKISFETGAGHEDDYLRSNFNTFLNKKVILEGEEIGLIELIEKSNIEEQGVASELFKKEGEEFFDITFDYPNEEWKGAHPYWIAVFPIGQEVGRGGKYFHAGGFNCLPSDNGIVLYYYLRERKVVLCVLDKYYEDFREAGKI